MAAKRTIVAIDCHAHVMVRNAPLARERHSAPLRDVTVDEYASVLDAHGISHGVLTAPSFYGTDNSLLLSALDAHPDRLRGTVIIEPDVDRETLAHMDRRGVVGIRLNWVRRERLPELSSYGRLFTELRRLGWHVEIYLEGRKLASVLPQLRDSGVTVVVDHFGAPDAARGVACEGFQQVLHGAASGDTFVKLSAAYRLGGVNAQPYVDALLAAGGPRQLVWASDWPFVSFEDRVDYARTFSDFVRWIPDGAIRRQVLVDTPARLFRFDTKAQSTSPTKNEGRR
ncbi:MAG TPA: amidohydrolase family protein [Casimicrobiaceae bacterium]|nr:amidohydrolase family protein [Casimicrobiaceae bacterium]